jgi:hypothetical protein
MRRTRRELLLPHSKAGRGPPSAAVAPWLEPGTLSGANRALNCPSGGAAALMDCGSPSCRFRIGSKPVPQTAAFAVCGSSLTSAT